MSSEIETPRLLLRPWTRADRELFALLNADAEVMEHFPSLLSRAESDALAERIQAHIETHGWGLWAMEIRGVASFAGFAGLSTPRFDAPFTPCVEVGWRLAKTFWGNGYASEAAGAALRFGFQTLDLSEIVSFTAATNLRSIRVMERIGMRRDPAGDFDHPDLPSGHPLRHHILYRKLRTAAS